MRLRKQNKWTRRLKKVAAPVAAAGAVAGTMVIAGGKDTLAAVPESAQGFANIVKEVGLHPLVECEGFKIHHRKLFCDRNRARSWVRRLQDLHQVK